MYDSNVEKSALCSIIMDYGKAQRDIDLFGINSDYFHLEPHQIIFESIIDLANASKPIDFGTVWQEAKIRASYLQQDDMAMIKNTGEQRPHYWLELLRDYFYIRQILYVFKWSEERLKNPKDLTETLALATEDLFRYQVELTKSDKTLKVEDLMEDMSLIPSTYKGINDVIIGYMKGRPTVIGARPKVGKTTFALCEIIKKIIVPDGHGWWKYGMHATMFSLEMSRSEIMRNLICILSGIKPDTVRRNLMTPEQVKRFRDYFDLINRAPLMIYDRPHSPRQVCTNMRYQSDQNNTQFVVIDYFQRLIQKGRKDREFFSVASNEIADAVKNLKSNPALLLFSQLNRSANMDMSQGSKHAAIPKVSDLKETGSLEEDAYTVGLMYWEPHIMEQKDKSIAMGHGVDDGITRTMIHWCMNRGGKSGFSELDFHKYQGRFQDVKTEEYL